MKKALIIVSLIMSHVFFIVSFLASGEKNDSGLPPLIPRQVLFGNPVNSSPQISPDGTRLAYLAPSDKGVMNVWVKPLDKGESVQATQEPRRGIRTYFWTADGRGILYLQDTDGDENFHVLLTDLKTNVTRDLTPFQGIRAVNLIPLPSEILVGLNIRNRQIFDMYRIDLETGAVRLDTENPGDVVYLLGNEWMADSAGEIRAARAMDFKDGSSILRVRDGRGQPWREIVRWTGGGLFDGDTAGFSKDGMSLYITSGAGSDTTRLVRIDTRTGRELQVIGQDPRCDLLASEALLHPETRAIQACLVNHTQREWKILDPGISRDFGILKNHREGFPRIVSRDKADSKWVVSYEVPDGPVSTWIYDRKSGDIRFVFDDRPDLKKYKLAIMKPVIITARDGLKLVAYLTMPAGVKPEKLSMVLYVHGGPTARDDWGYEPIVQLLANRGYAVLQVNFRGSVGFGNAFQRAGDGQVGIGAMQHDLTDAVKWAVGQGIADPKRVGIYGGSYGGYATLAGLAFTPELYACGAEECGPSNLKTMFLSIPSFYAPLKELFARIFGDVERDEDYNRKVSPLFHVDKIRAPLLIGQGANDPRCNIRESDQIVKAMRDRNLFVTYVVYSDEGHGFKRPENNMDFNGRLEEFLAKHLGGRFEPLEKIEGSTAGLR